MLDILAKDRITHPHIINHIDRLIAEAVCRGDTEVYVNGNSMSDKISEYYKSQGYNVDVEYVHLYNEPGIRKNIVISWKENE